MRVRGAGVKCAIGAALALAGCARNVDWVKERAEPRWRELGFIPVAYEGYAWSIICGGKVWYLLKREDSPGVVYSGYLCRWGDELHMYGPRVVSGNVLNHSGEIK